MSFRSSDMSVRWSGPVVWLSLLLCVTAFTPHDEAFRYQVMMSWRQEACTMCFGDECWSLQRDRCWYYAEVQEVLPSAEAGGEEGDVDGLVHDMVEQAAASWMFQDCLPLISQYTNCNKENMCVGCQACSCDAVGKWCCQAVQRCRADPELDVDHRVLVSVAETLKEDKTSRKRRSVENRTEHEAPRKLSYADMAEWTYGVKLEENLEQTSDINDETHAKASTADITTEKMGITATDYIEFDEVLMNIAIDTQKYNRRKPQLKESNEFKDYMDLDETVAAKNNDTNQFADILNAIIDENKDTTADPTLKKSTKLVTDLLAPFEGDERENFSNYNNMDLSSNIRDNHFSDDLNDTIIFDAINIMKRDVLSVSKLNLTTNTTTEKDTNTKSVTELRNNVLIPLAKIIDDKQQELKDLLKIKENLIQYIKEFNVTDLNLATKSQQIINSTNTVLSIYNLDIFPEIQFNLRKINPNVMDKLTYKLKRDIYEVIKDVVEIKKISKTNKLSEDLGNLIRAMSVYVLKQGNETNIIQNGMKHKNKATDLRRQSNEGGVNLNTIKDYLLTIIEILDKDKPQTEALSSLSVTTRKIVKRVIKNHYKDDFSVIGLRVYDPEYNLTDDLRKVGSQWQHMTANVATSAPADKIYAMKLLHFTLSVDINKLKDALALIEFAHSRRMIPIEGSLGEELLDKINTALRSIDDKIQIIINYKTNSKNRANVGTTVKQNKKKSFLSKIGNLLKGSKKDIVELANKKVPKSEIIKTIAKKRLGEYAKKKISEYEDTMRKWQNTLNVISKYKRSIDLSKTQNRMKNIIPKYLRGTLNPAIAGKNAKKTLTKTHTEATPIKPSKPQQSKITPTTVKTRKEETRKFTAKPKNNGQNSKTSTKRRIQAVFTKRATRNKVPNAKVSKSRR